MARVTRIEVVQQMYKTGIVPVFYHDDIAVCKEIVKACYDGGVRVFEFTNRGANAYENFKELKKYAVENLEGLMLGIGSLIDVATTAMFLQIGADFIVSPIVNSEMAKICNRQKIAWMPGCASVTEISYAEELGAEVVKIFPATSVGGPEFVKAIKGPLPWTSIMPTGGVEPTQESLNSWFAAGVHCVGLGSKLFVKNNDGSFNYTESTKTVTEAINLVQKIRK